MIHTLRATSMTLILTLLLAGSALAANCPHCGEPYGEGPSSDWEYIQRIRAIHESQCPARPGGGGSFEPDVRDVSVAYQHAHWQALQAAAKAREVAELAGQLGGMARQLFDSLSPEERSSVESSVAAMVTRARESAARNQAAQAELAALERKLHSLEARIRSSRDRNRQLLRQVAGSRSSVEDLVARLARAERELAAVRAAGPTLEKLAAEQGASLDRARAAFWGEVGEFFRGKELGPPREYMPAVRPRDPRTERSFATPQPKTGPAMQTPALASPLGAPRHAMAALLVSSVFRSGPAIAELPHGSVDQATFKALAERWQQEYGKEQSMARLSKRLMIESRNACEQLEKSLEVGRQRERERTWLKTKAGELKNKLDWALWDLDVSTRKSRRLVAETAEDWLESQRWEAIRKLWVHSLGSEALGNCAYAQIKLAYDLATGDLHKVPPAVGSSEDPEIRGPLACLAEMRAYDFWHNLFQIRDKPLEHQGTIRKLVESVFPEEERE